MTYRDVFLRMKNSTRTGKEDFKNEARNGSLLISQGNCNKTVQR